MMTCMGAPLEGLYTGRGYIRVRGVPVGFMNLRLLPDTGGMQSWR